MPAFIPRNLAGLAILLASAHSVEAAPTTTGRRRSRIRGGVIAGIVVACVAGIALLLLLCVCCRILSRRRSRGVQPSSGAGPSRRFGLPMFGARPVQQPAAQDTFAPPPGPPPNAQGYGGMNGASGGFGPEKAGQPVGYQNNNGVARGAGVAPPPPAHGTGNNDPFIGGFKHEA